MSKLIGLSGDINNKDTDILYAKVNENTITINQYDGVTKQTQSVYMSKGQFKKLITDLEEDLKAR